MSGRFYNRVLTTVIFEGYITGKFFSLFSKFGDICTLYNFSDENKNNSFKNENIFKKL